MRQGKSTEFFTCPGCKALYQVVKVRASSATARDEVACRSCVESLPAREGSFALKYFLLRHAGRKQGSGRPA
jgi:hypothetical protein